MVYQPDAEPNLLKTFGPVRGLPKGPASILLFEDDVVALVQHLSESELVVYDKSTGRMGNGPELEDAAENEAFAEMAKARRITKAHRVAKA